MDADINVSLKEVSEEIIALGERVAQKDTNIDDLEVMAETLDLIGDTLLIYARIQKQRSAN